MEDASLESCEIVLSVEVSEGACHVRVSLGHNYEPGLKTHLSWIVVVLLVVSSLEIVGDLVLGDTVPAPGIEWDGSLNKEATSRYVTVVTLVDLETLSSNSV